MRGLILFVIGIIGNVLGDEVSGWLPRIAVRLVKCNARRLPVEIAERIEEEWLGHVEAKPGPISKILFAADLFRATQQLRREFGITGPLSARAIRIRDVLIGAGTTLGAVPILLLVSVCVKFFGGRGPIFEQAERNSPTGRTVKVRRFRTVDETGKRTTVGRYLRRFDLDYLPLTVSLALGHLALKDMTGDRTLLEVLKAGFKSTIANGGKGRE